MGTLLPEVALLGVAVALTSPGSVVTVIALLTMSMGARRASAFIVGWLLAIGVIAVLMVVVLQGQDFHSHHTTPSRTASTVEILLGLMLLFVAARASRRPHVASKAQAQPKWLARVDRTHWSLEVVVGAVMLSYALTLTAAAETLKAHVTVVDDIVAGLVFAAASIITIAAPLAIATRAPDRAERVLSTWKTWILAHSRSIALVGLMVIGAALIAKGSYDLAV